jgi:ABC-type transporter Mla MlaB component
MPASKGVEMAKQVRPTVVGITGPADVRTIAQCHGRLLEAMKCSKAVQIDLAELAQADLTLVQLIEAARRFAVSAGATVSLSAPAGTDLCEILQRGGFLNAAESRAFWLHETGAN